MTGLLVCLLVVLLHLVRGDSHTKPYEIGEQVILWVNKIGPFRNPQESYNYFNLPYCQPEKVTHTHAEGLGEALQGYELHSSAMDFRFRKNVKNAVICEKTLGKDEVAQFRHAVENQYWYQQFLDDLPVWGMVGEMLPAGAGSKKNKVYLYTHKAYTVSYNADRVIEVNLVSENPVELTDDPAGQKITFTYSVTWSVTDVEFEKRFDKYLDDDFFKHQIHWFSVFNSFMMVIFLVGLVAMILMRTLRKDYARYAREDDLEDDDRVGDESGWKQIHGDVFRAPPNLLVFSALVGTGYQLAILVFLVIMFSILGTYYVKRGTLVTSFVFFYALTSFVAGWAGGGFYARAGGRLWIRNMLMIAGLFPGIILSVAFLLNFVAIAYQSLAAVPAGTMAAMLSIWLFLSFPLTVAGVLLGKNYDGQPDHPCRVNPVPRHIPERPWYLQRWVSALLGGVLPFGSIFIETYFIFTSFWHYKYYYVYGFLLMVYLILLTVSVCVTVVSTYFLLNAEDYRWHWTAFGSGASTALYVYGYSIYYFYFKTHMSGFFQTAFYFGYTAMVCFGLAILCGSVGFIGTSLFVRRIYLNIKID